MASSTYLGREVQGLLRGAALPIHGGSWHVLGEPGRQPAGARDVPGLDADGVDAPEDHVIDRAGIDVVAERGDDRVRASWRSAEAPTA